MDSHQLLPANIEYNALKHGQFIGIEFGCFVFQTTLGRWYCWFHPRKMYQGPRWTFCPNPGFRMDTPVPGISTSSWHAWFERQRETSQGKPLHRFHHEENGFDIENEWSEANSVVITKMFRVERPTYTELCYLQQKLEQFARMYPERVVQEETHEDVCGPEGLKIEVQSVKV